MKLHRHCYALSAVAAALLATTAGAQTSNVSLFGLIDTGLQRYSASGAASLTRMGTDGLSSTRWGMRGTESLGDGLSASFWLEGAFSGDSGSIGSTNTNNQSTGSATGLFGRRATVSLSGNFGEVRLGRDLTPAFLNLSDFNLYGTNGTGNAGAMFYRSSRARRTFAHRMASATSRRAGLVVCTRTSPMRLAKIRPTRMVATHRAASATNRGRCMSPLAPRVPTIWPVTRRKPPQVPAMTSAWRVSMRSGREQKATVENSAFHVGVAVPLGAFEVRAGYTDARVKGGDGARQIMGGVLYSLSKRTTLYVDASQVDNKGVGKTSQWATA